MECGFGRVGACEGFFFFKVSGNHTIEALRILEFGLFCGIMFCKDLWGLFFAVLRGPPDP